MTPAAHVAAAIEVLDRVLDGTPAEKALTGWARGHRFAGSKDRAAIRDLVFQALRCRASYAWLGGAETGRGIMLGAMRAAGRANAVFAGEGYGPAAVAAHEAGQTLDAAPRAVRLDMPEPMLPAFDRAFGAKADAVMARLKDRAGVFLRVNAARTSVAEAQRLLADDGIETILVQSINFGLQVTANERKVSNSSAHRDGLVELQDPASQAAVEALDLGPGARVLDYCAGGGGKALAFAAKGAKVTCHDIDPRRMKDIEPRAARAGVRIATATEADLAKTAPFDVVFVDAPCSGSGTWRRAPEAKWAMTPKKLAAYCSVQDEVVAKAARFLAPGGLLAYATCSVFVEENADRVEKAQTQQNLALEGELILSPDDQNDGFYMARLRSKG